MTALPAPAPHAADSNPETATAPPAGEDGHAATPSARLIWRFLREFGPGHWPRIGLAVVAMLVVAGATSLTAWLMKPVIDNVAVAGDRSMLWLVALALPGAFALKGIANYVQRATMNRVGLGMIAAARRRLFAHLLSLDLAFFQANPAGTLTSRLIVDMDFLKQTLSGTLVTIGRDLTTLIALTGTMIAMDWKLAVVGLMVFPLLVGPVVVLGRIARARSSDLQESLGTYDAMLHQSFEGVRVVKVFGTAARERARGRALVERVFAGMLRLEKVAIQVTFLTELAAGTAVTAVVLYGGHRVISGATTAGTFFAFITVLVLAYRPIKKLGRLNTVLQEGTAAIQRLFVMLDARPHLREAADARSLAVQGGGVRLEGVTFTHPRALAPALTDVSLDIPAGRKVAVVGPSGAGKSTVLNLVARLIDPESGRVLIDGQDVATVSLTSLRRSLSLVTQDVTLFEGTVLDNILFGAAEVPDPADPTPDWRARAEAAARAAEAHDFIMALPRGYETSVGESGLRLSGGQRQRIAIARAMVKDAPLLLLDEATAALDRDTERRVQAALDRLGEGRTTLVVAHRLATIRDADLIHVMRNGRVLESGDHDSLLAQGGLYARLWRTQGGGS